MKSLNRTLALVLVLVMVFGLFGVASAAKFTDSTTVQYKEAVEVMTGIGAINGYTDGTFKPTATITREEAAKLVAYTVLGATAAKTLSVTATGFSDVAADRWSAPFIAYCVNAGIINGMGDGTFAPTANVTGYQLAKMLLCALGYGKKGEFTGTAWELNTAVLALSTGVFANAKTASYSVAATREEAALYCFNALFIQMVAYSKDTESYVGVTTTVSTSDYRTRTTTVPVTIASAVYGFNSNMDSPSATSLVKVFDYVNGVYGYNWYYKNSTTPISSFYTDEVVIGTSTNGKSIETLATKSNANPYFIATLNSAEYYINGEFAGYSAPESTIGLGVKVEFVDTNDDTDTAEKVYITTYAVKVLAAAPVVKTSTVDGKDYIYVNFTAGTDIGGTSSIDYSVLASDVTGYTGLVKGDVVLFTDMYDGPYVLTKAPTFTGAVTASSSTSFTIGGSTYKAAKNADVTITSYDEGYLNSVAFYTDTTGYLVYAAAVTATSTDYLYVVDSNSYESASTTFDTDTNQSYVTFATGATATITVDSVDGDEFADGDMYVPEFSEIYSYVKNTDGTYALTSVAGTYLDASTYYVDDESDTEGLGAITKGATSLKDDDTQIAKANASTVFVVRNIKEAASTSYATSYYSTWTVYTGYASVPTMADASYSVVSGTDGYADVVYVYAYTTEAAKDTSVIYLLDTAATAVYKAGGVDYYTFPAIVDGVKTVVKAAASTDGEMSVINKYYGAPGCTVVPGTLCAVTYTDGKLAADSIVPVNVNTVATVNGGAGYTNFACGTSITAPASGVIEIGGVGYNYTSTTVVFYISADMSTVTMDVAANLSDMDADVIISAVTMAAGVDLPTSTQENTLKAIFIQAD